MFKSLVLSTALLSSAFMASEANAQRYSSFYRYDVYISGQGTLHCSADYSRYNASIYCFLSTGGKAESTEEKNERLAKERAEQLAKADANPYTRVAGGSKYYIDADIDTDGKHGDIELELAVTALGRVAGCAVVTSTGDSAVDETVCNLVHKRARYDGLNYVDGVNADITTKEKLSLSF